MELNQLTPSSLWSKYSLYSLNELTSNCKNILPPTVCDVQQTGSSNNRSIIYRCKTCGIDDTSCICAQCFKRGNHEGHEFYAYTTTGPYTCDCGNDSSWKRTGFCPLHGNPLPDDIFSLIPTPYHDVIDSFKKLLNDTMLALQNKNSLNITLYSEILHTLTDVNLFFHVIGQLLNVEVHPTNSKLIEELGYSSICQAEFFFEICFTWKDIPVDFLNWMRKYLTELTIMKFNYVSIYDLTIASINNSFSNEDLVRTVSFHFGANNPQLIDEFFATNRFLQLLKKFEKMAKKTVLEMNQQQSSLLNQQIDNMINVIFWFLTEHQKIQRIEFTSEVYTQLLSLLSVCSNTSPIYIKTDEHVEFDDNSFDMNTWLFENSHDLSSAVLDIATPSSLLNAYPLIHQFTIDHITKYLSSTQSKLIPGLTFPVSPISPLLQFYTQVLLIISPLDGFPGISSKDALILSSSSLSALCFKEYYIANLFVRNGAIATHQFIHYTSIYASYFILSDLTLLQFLITYVNINDFINLCFDMFQITLEPPSFQYLDSLLRIFTEISRVRALKEKFSPPEMLRQCIIHYTAAGFSNPSKIHLLTPYSMIPLEPNYDAICYRKGKIREEFLNSIDPVFPLFSQIHREALLKITTSENSPKPRPFYYEPLPDSPQIHQLLTSPLFLEMFLKFIKSRIEKPQDIISALPFFLFCMTDAISRSPLPESTILLEIANLLTQITLPTIFTKALSSLSDDISLIFKSIKQTKNKTPQIKTQSKKEMILKKMREKQKMFKSTMNEPVEQFQTLSQDSSSQEICVVCQQNTNDVLGRLVEVVSGEAVEITAHTLFQASYAPLTITTCCHHIHKSCFQRMVNERYTCPVCVAQYSLFLPLSSTIIKQYSTHCGEDIMNLDNVNVELKDVEILYKSLLELNVENSSHYDIILWCLQSTLFSIELLLSTTQTQISDEDRDLIRSLFLAFKPLSKTYASSYILSQLPSNSFPYYITNRALGYPATPPPKLSNATKLFESIITNNNTPVKLEPKVPLQGLQVLEKTMLELLTKLTSSKCDECNEELSEVLNSEICLVCGDILCSKCINKHRNDCCCGFGVYFNVLKAALCLSEGSIVRGIVVYINKYGEPFSSSSLQSGQYLLNQDKVNEFLKAYCRGDVMRSALFVDFDQVRRDRFEEFVRDGVLLVDDEIQFVLENDNINVDRNGNDTNGNDTNGNDTNGDSTNGNDTNGDSTNGNESHTPQNNNE
ncbi:E3 ubiquitin-protein ligase [Entamoeba marina]